MTLSLEQVVQMAPDGASAAAGKKLASIRHWQSVGRDATALLGQCQGSALYQVRIELGSLGYGCSCPSRKFPCKHVLGLLMLVAQSPDAIADASPPEWVSDWLAKRVAKETKKAEKQQEKEAKPVDEKAQVKRSAEREGRVREGLARLDLWLADLVRNGIAGLESQPAGYFEEQARRLVDAQAPGLASRVSRLAAIPGSGRDWPRRLLGELGRLKLALHAYSRIDQLDPLLQADLRQFIGWSIKDDELSRDGEMVEDAWIVAGQWIDDEDRVRAQRSWAVGRQTGRTAIILQFAPGNIPFAESIVPGTEQLGVLAFYPGAARQRARFVRRDGEVANLSQRMPGAATIEAFLTGTAEALARLPWLSAFGAVLHDVKLVVQDDHWLVRDRDGQGLPLVGKNHWPTLAISGGQPFDLAGEWDGQQLRPLGMFFGGRYRVVGS